QRIAIDLAGGGQQKSGSLGLCQSQCLMRTQGAYLQGLNRHLQVIDRRSGGSKMQNQIKIPAYMNEVGDIMLDKGKVLVAHLVGNEDFTFIKHEVGDIMLDKGKVLVAHQVSDIIAASGDEVVHTDHLISFRQVTITEVRAQEAGSTRN